MGSSTPPELGLNFRLSSATKTYVPKAISDVLAEVSMISDTSERLLKLDDYVNRLQDEMKKIDAFKRVLPLCMLLLKDAIVTMEEELKQCKKSNAEPVLEEFIPLKKSNDDQNEKAKACTEKDINNRDKMNWMSSVQLWNSDHHHHHQYPNLDLNNNTQTLKLDIKKGVEEEIHRPVMNDLFRSGKNRTMGRESVPFKGCKSYSEGKEERNETGLSLCIPDMKISREDISYNGLSSKSSCSRLGSSLVANVGSNLRTGQQSKQQQTARKQRRCWSPELHRRFVDALQQLGGPQVATPKQIRELMQVDSLTNDEVKSHLQKYRLHARRVQSTSTNQPVVLGSLWLSQEQCGESSKPTTSQSGSPQGPLHLTGSSRATSMTAVDSTEEEDDENFESHSWKSRALLSDA